MNNQDASGDFRTKDLHAIRLPSGDLLPRPLAQTCRPLYETSRNIELVLSLPEPLDDSRTEGPDHRSVAPHAAIIEKVKTRRVCAHRQQVANLDP